MAKAIQYSQLGGPEVLTLNDVPDPVAGPGQVTVRVEAVGVNPIDWKLRSGIRPSPAFDGPRGTGSDGAGVVTSVGDGVDGLRIGMPVAFMNATGAYASDIAIDAADVYQRPSGVSAAEGAALGVPASTAYQAVLSLGVGADDVVLVHGGSGAVGQFVVQFARLAGATVIATGSERRHATIERLGGIPVVYGDGVVERVRHAAGRDVTVAIDCAGAADAFTTSVELVADRSRIVTIVRGSEADEWGVRAFMGGSPHPLTAQQRAWRQDAMPVSLALLAAGALHVEIGDVRPLAEAAEAQAASQAGSDGKLILVP